MEYLKVMLNYIGIELTDTTEPIVVFCIGLLTLSVVALLAFINIGIYLLTIHIANNKTLLEYIADWKILLKMIDIYKKTRIAFIIIEIGFFMFCQLTIISLCLKVIYGLSKIT